MALARDLLSRRDGRATRHDDRTSREALGADLGYVARKEPKPQSRFNSEKHEMSEGHYYEDFAVGQKFHSRPFRMEADRITAFAEEFDPQPQHLSERTAATSQFGELVASGWHTAAVSMRLFIVEALPPIAGGGQGAGLEALAWPRPVRPGDELHVEAEVIAARLSRSRPEKGLVTVRSITLNQNDEVVMAVTHTVMVPRRDVGP